MTERSAAYHTRDFRALDFDFTVETDHAGLAQYLDSAFSALVGPRNASHVVAIKVGRNSPVAHVAIDGEALSVPPDSAHLLPTLMSALNRAAADSAADRVLVHASAVEADGRTVFFPAPMEAGKSTLAAGLLRAGFRYVTDEAVALDRTTLEVQPYPRPITVDRGSWSVLGDLRPRIPHGVERFCTDQWHVSPLDVRPDAIARPSRPSVVAFPRYVPEKRTQARPIGRAQALCELVGCAFNLDQLGTPAFHALARVVTTSRCYRLTVSDLERACDAVVRIAHDLDSMDASADAAVVTEPGFDIADAGLAPARRPGVVWVSLDRIVVYDPDAGRVVRLNASGSLLWQVLDGETPLQDLAVEIASAFGSDPGAVESDVVALARRLARLGLLASQE